MKKALVLGLAGVIPLVILSLAACESSASASRIVELEARIAELEAEVGSLRQQLAGASTSTDTADDSVRAAVSELERRMQSLETYIEGPVTQDIAHAQKDIEALHRIACDLTGLTPDYFDYIEQRYGEFQFDDRRGRMVIDLPGPEQILSPFTP